VYLYENTAEKLAAELRSRRPLPRAVFLSPSTDPFPPYSQIQQETVRAVEVLHRFGVEAWLMTRGIIRPFALRCLEPFHDRLRIIVGLTTTDRSLQRTLEPLAAPPRLRLRQIARLRAMGCRVQAAVEPLLPGLTDTRANLGPLLEALAAAGVTHVTAAYMFLRPGIRDNLERILEPHGCDETVLDAFERGPVLKTEYLKAARYLPKQRRQRGYATLMSLAANLGITVSVSGVTNPDFERSR
jgi:DNA repair photolyase